MNKIENILIKIRRIPCFYCLVFLVFLFTYIFIDSHQHKHVVKIAVGREDGAYYVYAQEYAKELKKYGVELQIKTTAGAKEAQEKTISDEVDFAFVQGGLEVLDQGILALANIAHEPVWVLTRREDNITKFAQLKDKTINIGHPKSGTNPIAKELLFELLGKKNCHLTESNVTQAFHNLKEGKIDALFYVIARSSISLQNKINDTNIRIMSFDNAESIRKHFIRNDMIDIRNSYYKVVYLKKYSLYPFKKLPREDKILLVKRTLLVTKNASNSMVRLFLKVAHKIHSQEAFFHDEDYFINTRGLKYQQHSASKRYFKEPVYRYEQSNLLPYQLEKEKNYWLAQTLQKIEDAILTFIIPLGLIGYFIEVLYPISKIYTRRKINRWYRQINNIDTGIENCSREELKSKVIILKMLLVEVENEDNIDVVHLEAYYSVQHQIRDLIKNLTQYIDEF